MYIQAFCVHQKVSSIENVADLNMQYNQRTNTERPYPTSDYQITPKSKQKAVADFRQIFGSLNWTFFITDFRHLHLSENWTLGSDSIHLTKMSEIWAHKFRFQTHFE